MLWKRQQPQGGASWGYCRQVKCPPFAIGLFLLARAISSVASLSKKVAAYNPESIGNHSTGNLHQGLEPKQGTHQKRDLDVGCTIEDRQSVESRFLARMVQGNPVRSWYSGCMRLIQWKDSESGVGRERGMKFTLSYPAVVG